MFIIFCLSDCNRIQLIQEEKKRHREIVALSITNILREIECQVIIFFNVLINICYKHYEFILKILIE